MQTLILGRLKLSKPLFESSSMCYSFPVSIEVLARQPYVSNAFSRAQMYLLGIQPRPDIRRIFTEPFETNSASSII